MSSSTDRCQESPTKHSGIGALPNGFISGKTYWQNLKSTSCKRLDLILAGSWFHGKNATQSLLSIKRSMGMLILEKWMYQQEQQSSCMDGSWLNENSWWHRPKNGHVRGKHYTWTHNALTSLQCYSHQTTITGNEPLIKLDSGSWAQEIERMHERTTKKVVIIPLSLSLVS